jgi:hypothetical protein
MKVYPKLNVGAGRIPKSEGRINADLYPGENIDVVFDATKPWPIKENSIGSIEANHCLEHLPEPWTFFREAWGALVPSPFCNVFLRLPYGPGVGGIGDITHVKQYVPYSFACFQPGYNDAVNNPQHDEWDRPFSVMSIYLRINPNLRRLCKPIIRRWGVPLLSYLWDGYSEMIIGMRALKTEADVDKWKATEKANVVPIAQVMYEHEYQDRALKDGEQLRWVFFGEGAKRMQKLSDGG